MIYIIGNDGTPVRIDSSNTISYNAGDNIDIKNNTISYRESYSTSEHFTGKYWTDGKPIYRIVINTTMPSATSDWKTILSGVGMVTDIFHYITHSANEIYIQHSSSLFYITENTLKMQTSSTYQLSKSVTIIVEYTKN